MTPLLLSLALASGIPSAEAQQLGRKLAEQGTLASLLPLLKVKETDELIKEDPSLTAAEQAKLRSTANRVFAANFDRLMKATGDAWAERLSLEDLRALTRFFGSPVAARYRAKTPAVIIATMQLVGQIDFKGDVRTSFCAEAKRLCPKK